MYQIVSKTSKAIPTHNNCSCLISQKKNNMCITIKDILLILKTSLTFNKFMSILCSNRKYPDPFFCLMEFSYKPRNVNRIILKLSKSTNLKPQTFNRTLALYRRGYSMLKTIKGSKGILLN